jgi:hypothetical protein
MTLRRALMIGVLALASTPALAHEAFILSDDLAIDRPIIMRATHMLSLAETCPDDRKRLVDAVYADLAAIGIRGEYADRNVAHFRVNAHPYTLDAGQCREWVAEVLTPMRGTLDVN